MISNEESLLKFALQASNQGRTVVFDLDNTLYPEDSFLELAYHNFSAEISLLFGLDHGVLHAYMMNCIQIGLRNNLLQNICAEFDLPFFFVKVVYFIFCVKVRFKRSFCYLIGQNFYLRDPQH